MPPPPEVRAPAPTASDKWAVPADLPIKRQRAARPAPPRPPKSNRLVLVLVLSLAAVAVLACGGGGWYWWSTHKADTVALQPAVVAPATVETAPAATAPTPPPDPAAGLAEVLSASSPQGEPAAPAPLEAVPAAAEALPEMPAPPAAARRAVQQQRAPAPEPRHTPIATDVCDVMASKVRNLLGKADGYIATRQYDKAMAMAESALELDPSSSAAKSMISKAKSRQMEALKSGSSID